MKKKTILVAITVLITIFTGWLIWHFNQKYANQFIQNIQINIQNPSKKVIYQEEDILKILTNKHGNLLTKKIKEINTLDLLATLGKNPWFKGVNLYLENQTLQINLTVRTPIARIYERSGKFYYIDQDGYVLPRPDKPVFKTLVINGKNIPPYIPGLKLGLIEDISYDSLQKISTLSKLYYLSFHVEKDTLMRELISQVYVRSSNQFELITFLTEQPLVLGDIDNLKTKLNNIRYFFKYGLPLIELDKYSSFHFQYTNQVLGIRKNETYEKQK